MAELNIFGLKTPPSYGQFPIFKTWIRPIHPQTLAILFSSSQISHFSPSSFLPPTLLGLVTPNSCLNYGDHILLRSSLWPSVFSGWNSVSNLAGRLPGSILVYFRASHSYILQSDPKVVTLIVLGSCRHGSGCPGKFAHGACSLLLVSPVPTHPFLILIPLLSPAYPLGLKLHITLSRKSTPKSWVWGFLPFASPPNLP